jgi:hypothetical protein
MKTIQLFILSILFACISQVIQAQPTQSAPEPTRDEADVYSLFSDYYSTQGKGPEPQTYGGQNPVVKEAIPGIDPTDYVLKSTGGSHGVFTSGWQGQKKGFIHIDVFSVSGGAFSFGVGSGFNADSKWPASFTWPTLQAGVWTSIDVPVIEFVKAGLDDAVNIQNIKFSGSGTYYVDNIYAYGTKEVYVEPARVAIAPTPGHATSDVKSVFSDSYPNSQKGFTPQTFGGILAKVMPYESAPTQSVIRLTGLGTSFAMIDTWKIEDKPYIHLDVYYESGGDGFFSVGLSNAFNQNSTVFVDNYNWPVTRQGQWVGIDIPSQIFKTAGVNINQITAIHFKGSGNFYVDNLYAYNSNVVLDTDATLRTLAVSTGTLTPAFNAATTNYSVTVDEAVTSISITAEANSAKASVTGTGTKSLSLGANTFNIVVTAESQNTQTYNITVNRGEGSGNNDQDVLLIKPMWANDPNWSSANYTTDPRYVMHLNPVTGLYEATLTLDHTYQQITHADNTKYYYFVVDKTTGGGSIKAGNARIFQVSENATSVTFYAKKEDTGIRFVNDAQQMLAWVFASGGNAGFMIENFSSAKIDGKATYELNLAFNTQIKFQVQAKNNDTGTNWAETQVWEDFYSADFTAYKDGKINVAAGVYKLAAYYTSLELFLQDPIPTTGIEKISTENNLRISAENGIIQAKFDGTATIKLYSIAGQLINRTIANGSFTQAVNNGIYILSIDGKAHKVLVK